MAKAKYIEGTGWRCEGKHRMDRLFDFHDYTRPSTYHITLMVAGRRPLFGRVEGTTLAPGNPPHVVLSPLGHKVMEEELPKITAYFPMAEVWRICLMPDHLHMILHVNAPLPPGKHLGDIVRGFKIGCGRALQALMAGAEPEPEPVPGPVPDPAGEPAGKVTAAQPAPPAPATFAGAPPPANRAPGTAPAFTPLFEPHYNHTILMHDDQLLHWKAYIRDNPYRYMFRKEHPDIMRRCLCVEIDGVRFGAFGNMLLLRHPEKLQVFFHRRTEEAGLLRPTEETAFWQQERQRLLMAASQGAVLVTPGISECEKRMKNECLAQHLRLIHLQQEPIGACWKPERSRFEACAAGMLLILAPWADELSAHDSDYARFHRLNDMAAAICRITSETRCVVKA